MYSYEYIKNEMKNKMNDQRIDRGSERNKQEKHIIAKIAHCR